MNKQHADSLIFTLINLLGSFIIIIISFIKQYVNSHELNFAEIAKNGDVYIICASMAISSIYCLYTFKREIENNWPTLFFWASIVNYTASLIFYLLSSKTSTGIDKFWIFSSLLIFIINIFTTYASSYFQNINTNIIEHRRNESLSLQNKFVDTMRAR